MPEVNIKNFNNELFMSQGTYEILLSLHNDIRSIRNELYSQYKLYNTHFYNIDNSLNSINKNLLELKQHSSILNNEADDFKLDIKELRRDVNDIKGDIKALYAGFQVAQSKFNRGLVILGIIVALIQLLK